MPSLPLFNADIDNETDSDISEIENEQLIELLPDSDNDNAISQLLPPTYFIEPLISQDELYSLSQLVIEYIDDFLPFFFNTMEPNLTANVYQRRVRLFASRAIMNLVTIKSSFTLQDQESGQCFTMYIFETGATSSLHIPQLSHILFMKYFYSTCLQWHSNIIYSLSTH